MPAAKRKVRDVARADDQESIVRALAALYAAREADAPSVWVAGRIDECIARLEKML